MFNWLKENLTLVYIMVFIATLIAPWLLTRGLTNIDFTNTGQIGDTIGGLTAPFLNLLSVTLLYLTLKEQMKFNKDQSKDSSEKGTVDALMRMHSILKRDISGFSYLDNNNKELKGYESIAEYKEMLSILCRQKAQGLAMKHGNNDSINLKRLDTVFPEVLNTFYTMITTLHNFDVNAYSRFHFWSLLTFDYDHFKEILDKKCELTGVREQSDLLQTKWDAFEALAAPNE